jgi:hypothetical protein
VAVRLGLIPASVDVGPAHAWLEAQLPPEWDAQQVYDNHEVLMLHGQRVCHWRDPACARCVVLDLCPTGQARLGPVEGGPGAGMAAAVAPPAVESVPEQGLPPESAPPRAARGRRATTRSPRPRPQEQLEMSVHPHPEKGPAPERGDHAPQGEHTTDGRAGEISASDRERLQSVHADPDQLNAEAREQAARRNSVADDVRNPEHYKLTPEERAHGTHGKGFSDEARLDDEVAVDSGDDPQFRRGGAGRDEAPDPTKFAKNAEGRMGGPGWGSESVGGSAVDRRPERLARLTRRGAPRARRRSPATGAAPSRPRRRRRARRRLPPARRRRRGRTRRPAAPTSARGGRVRRALVALLARLHRWAESGHAGAPVCTWNALQGSVVPGPSEGLLIPLGVADPPRAPGAGALGRAGATAGGSWRTRSGSTPSTRGVAAGVAARRQRRAVGVARGAVPAARRAARVLSTCRR